MQLLLASPSFMPQLLFIASNTLDATCLEHCLDALVAFMQAARQQQEQQGLHVSTADSPSSTPSCHPAPAAIPVQPSSASLLDFNGLLDIVLHVLTAACQQGHDQGAEVGGPAQRQVSVTATATDAALRLLEEMAATHDGKVLLLLVQPKQEADGAPLQAQGSSSAQHASSDSEQQLPPPSVEEQPGNKQTEYKEELGVAPADARQLPALLLRLLLLSARSLVGCAGRA